jgi:TorA-specific chaperone
MLASRDELIAIMRNRAQFYRLLARVFAGEVDAKFVAALDSEKALMSAMRGLSRRGYEALREFYKLARERSSDAVVEELAVEYAALFLGTEHVRGRRTRPYASVHLSEDRTLMQEPFARIRDFYSQSGFARLDGSRELEDHISVMLEFLGQMAESTAEHLMRRDSAAQEWLRLQEAFLSEHMLTWTPTFCRHVSQDDETGFYKGFALITSALLKADKEVVQDVRCALSRLTQGAV